jgi:hypothetical protein
MKVMSLKISIAPFVSFIYQKELTIAHPGPIENPFDLSTYKQLEYVHFEYLYVPPRNTVVEIELRNVAAALETLPVMLSSAAILISLSFRDWNDGCDTIRRMDAFLANHTTVRKVEIIITDKKRQYIDEEITAELPILLAANKLGLGRSEETWTVFNSL